MTNILDTLRDSSDIKQFPIPKLEALAQEIRERIIQTISNNGGHFGGPMGVVEMSIALHYVFDFPKDRLIWDVGHQVYPHKLLTGRAERFHTLRTEAGITGYPAPEESPYDLFTTAHAGTAASSATGLAAADALLGRRARTVAVVGDGALSAGVAYEALNHAGGLDRNLLVILNDNSMSIDKSVGGLARFLDQVRVHPTWVEFKRTAKHYIEQIPLVGRQVMEMMGHLKDGLRATIGPHHLFEPMGFRYFGPYDGHDLKHLIGIFQQMRDVKGPVLLHLHTEKGRGFPVKNPDPLGFHALTPFCLVDGKVEKKAAKASHKSWTEVFSGLVCELAAEEPRMVCITAAMPDGTGLLKFRDKFPDRYFDVGICEQHGVAFAAGMAKAGIKPVAAIYSTFLQRAFDQIFHEVSLQNLPVVFAMDRGGLVGNDGPTHHGLADIAYMRLWPNVVVCAPADAAEMKECMKFALASDKSVAFRYPRDEAVPELAAPTPPFELGKARVMRTGEDAVLIGYGVMTVECLKAADILAGKGVGVGVINARFCKPLDEKTLGAALADYPVAFTVEDHFLTGGFGSALLEFAAERPEPKARVVRIGVADKFIPHATRRRQLEWTGLTAEAIAGRVLLELQRSHDSAAGLPAMVREAVR